MGGHLRTPHFVYTKLFLFSSGLGFYLNLASFECDTEIAIPKKNKEDKNTRT